jgi:hypothetical protein
MVWQKAIARSSRSDMGKFTRFTSRPDGAADGRAVRVSLIKNVGKLAGKSAAQVYLRLPIGKAGWEGPKRLGGFAKAKLQPGQQTY